MILRQVHKLNWQNEKTGKKNYLIKASLALIFLVLIELGFFCSLIFSPVTIS